MDWDRRLERLRGYRVRQEPDRSMAFLEKDFKQQVEKPFKQLGDLTELWGQLVPEHLARQSRLESLSRGVLRVSVSSSAHLFELDGLLRQGLTQRLISAHKGSAFRRVQLRVGRVRSA